MWSSKEALSWLDDHVNIELAGARKVAAPRLDRMQGLARLLGSPHSEYPVVHITGTNGKTSTARMAASLLAAHGLSVGLYTSPHLESVNERIVWNGEPIDGFDLAEILYAVSLAEDALGEQVTFFEIMTAAAFRFFADVSVDVAVVEVGLGGTWDATNIADGAVAVVTNVSIDHTEYLGETRESIALEKAGIVKSGATLVLGEEDLALREIFTSRGAANVLTRGSDFGVIENRTALSGRVVDLFTPTSEHPELFIPLHGSHQADNAAAALAASEAFVGGPIFDSQIVSDAFAGVRVAGRLEVMARRPLVLLDGAHNVAGARALSVALEEEFPAGSRTLVVGLLVEKDPAEMLEALDAPSAAQLVVCRPPSPRGRDPEEVAAAAVAAGVPPSRVRVVETPGDALAYAVSVTPEDGQVVVTGSLYVVGAARAALQQGANSHPMTRFVT